MEYGDNLNFRRSFVLPINHEVGTHGPEEHVARCKVYASVTAARPLSQILEGTEELLDQMLCRAWVILCDEFLNLEKIFERERREFIERHGSLFAACATQPGSCLFWPEAFSLFQLLKAKINLRADFG